MVEYSSGTFRCVLQTPHGKLLDCRAGSLILPGYDGLMGVLRNHAPMLCKLGRGIMQVKEIPGRDDAFFLIEGGFSRISENYVTVLAFDVMTFEGMDKAQVEGIVTNAREAVHGQAYIRHQLGEVDIEKARFIVKMAQMASVI